MVTVGVILYVSSYYNFTAYLLKFNILIGTKVYITTCFTEASYIVSYHALE